MQKMLKNYKSMCQIAYYKTLCNQNTCIDTASLKLFVPPTQTHNICPEHATIINTKQLN